MSDHIIIVGGGRVGRHAAAELNPGQHTISVIERDAEQCEHFPQHLASNIIYPPAVAAETAVDRITADSVSARRH